ncbi:Acg family FMN-binding oxidoreductase [Rhodococcoides kyotonense]|uniref:Nitroreductase domain-containing protein n=1 Tax=Rhodococcoides kyotonense TaxID=398843 RepID=A0A177YJN1_9NOCA|nr:hypothetical protein [Rhodococcus kyotonensis]OAK55713.1 hypothetical protein A3K89_19260 [Rhodococcus kyotonensis]
MNVGPDAAVVAMLVELACRAPSVHNSQPWTWKYSNGCLDLYSDRTRLLDVIDPMGRQMLISCGAALDHLQKAAEASRWTTEIETFPTPGGSRHLARIRFVPGARPRSHEFDLLTAINRRYTDRRPFGAVRRDLVVGAEMRRAADVNQTILSALTDGARQVLEGASKTSANTRKYDATYQAELKWWSGHSFDVDGVPPHALSDRATATAVRMGRDFPVRDGGDQVPPEDASTVLLMATRGDEPLDWLRCGRALSAVLLEATVRGFATCSLTHLTEQSSSRAIVASLAPHGGIPQVLVRIGTPTAGTPAIRTPRQKVSSVLSIEGPRQRVSRTTHR